MLKQAIQLNKPIIAYYQFERLVCCRHCKFFTVIQAEHCFKCQRQLSYIHIREYAKLAMKRKVQTICFTASAGILFGLLFAGTISNLILFSLVCVIIFALQITVYYLCKKQILNVFLQQLFVSEKDNILNNLSLEIEYALSLINSGNLKEAYERLRLLGGIINNDYVKFAQLDCLNHFIIRSDMDLQLDELVPTQHSVLFDNYLKEILQVKPSLIKLHTYSYVTRYQNQITASENGHDMLLRIAATMTSMKFYIDRYQYFILEYVEQFPRDKFLKLCQIIFRTDESNQIDLRKRCAELIEIHYAYDPDFQKLV